MLYSSPPSHWLEPTNKFVHSNLTPPFLICHTSALSWSGLAYSNRKPPCALPYLFWPMVTSTLCCQWYQYFSGLGPTTYGNRHPPCAFLPYLFCPTATGTPYALPYFSGIQPMAYGGMTALLYFLASYNNTLGLGCTVLLAYGNRTPPCALPFFWPMAAYAGLLS